MRAKDVVISAVADLAARRIVGQTVAWLKKIKAELSGDDTPLKSAWDEICVQVQSEESFFRDAYVETARTDLAARMGALKEYQRLALWLRTDEGFEWLLDQGNRADEEAPPIDNAEIARYLWENYVLPRAEEYTN